MHTRITYEELLDWSCVLLLLGFAFYAVAPFLDRLYLYVFEGDAEATVAFASAFARFFYSFDVKALPGLYIYPPDFDAQFIIYGAARVMVDGLVHVGVIATSLQFRCHCEAFFPGTDRQDGVPKQSPHRPGDCFAKGARNDKYNIVELRCSRFGKG
jgi:hypothetical protein